MKKIILFVLLLVFATAGFFIWKQVTKTSPIQVSNFEECQQAGFPVTESYPAQCRTPDGKTFTQDIGNELEKQDLVRVESPRPNQIIASPLMIKGEARGTWFFEASFPVRLVDNNGRQLAVTIARAQSDWMTEGFVPFTAELIFTVPDSDHGTLILEKDNPSGLPEQADELHLPVKFK